MATKDFTKGSSKKKAKNYIKKANKAEEKKKEVWARIYTYECKCGAILCVTIDKGESIKCTHCKKEVPVEITECYE